MAGKISSFFREYVYGFSILLIIIGLILLILSILSLQQITLDGLIAVFIELGLWNAYILILGLIILATGSYYLYSFQKDKRFVLKEFDTNKRSELLKRHKELRQRVKHLPSKYQHLLNEKEQELHIK